MPLTPGQDAVAWRAPLTIGISLPPVRATDQRNGGLKFKLPTDGEFRVHEADGAWTRVGRHRGLFQRRRPERAGDYRIGSEADGVPGLRDAVDSVEVRR